MTLETVEGYTDTQKPFHGPSHRSNPLLAQLSAGWRVVVDPMQWILQRKASDTNWNPRSFCSTREGLLRCVREYCGEVDPLALATLRALPEWHPDREPQ